MVRLGRDCQTILEIPFSSRFSPLLDREFKMEAIPADQGTIIIDIDDTSLCHVF